MEHDERRPGVPDPDEEAERFRRLAATGDRRIRNEIVESHLGLAHHLAARYGRTATSREDLDQVALLGLVKAVDRFDVERGVAFSTFAGRTIEGELKRHFRDATWAVRVPRSVKELHLNVRGAAEDLSHALGRPPTVRELAAHLEVDADDVVVALGAAGARRSSSLDAPAPDSPTDHQAVLGSEDERLATVDDRAEVEHLLAALAPREQEIVRLRFYERLSQSEIAERVGLSQMHVSRLLRRSFDAMRDAADERAARGGRPSPTP